MKTTEIFKANNKQLTSNLIPKGYPKLEVSKVYDDAFQQPIQSCLYVIERLINN